WNNPKNWLFNQLPTAQSDVLIDLDEPDPITVTLTSGNPTIHSLTTDETLAIFNTTLTLLDESTIKAGGILSLDTATLAGTGRLINKGTIGLDGATISASLQNEADVVVTGTGTITGALETTTSSVIKVQTPLAQPLTVTQG